MPECLLWVFYLLAYKSVSKKTTLFDMHENFNLAVTDLIFMHQAKMLYKIVEKLGIYTAIY